MAKKDGIEPLFVTEKVKGRILYRLFATSIFVGIVFVWVYRVSHIPSYSQEDGIIRILVWIGMLLSELWFGFYWFLTQSVRWNRVHRRTFPHRLSQRYGENLPKVDIFVCTADPEIEQPVMVINTVLSVMAYDYPPENLSIYLSDDAGSEITFYALLEASRFSKYWLPYCKKFCVEPRSPAAYFESLPDVDEISDASHAKEFASIKKLYQEMENRIEVANKLGRVVDRAQHKGFCKWDSYVSRGNHDTIMQILIDGRDPDAKDIAGCTLPTLVYLAREKRPQHFHNFKAGAMNALIRVSSGISNAPVILNVDCDMYSNNSESIREALCFFMDEKNGHEIAYVQFPQSYKNMTKNDLYGSCMVAVREVEFPGIDGYGGPLYIGSGCFHRREILCGRKFQKDDRIELKNNVDNESITRNVHELEEKLSSLASCSYEEKNTKWGNEMGLKYGCPVEDVITGLSIQCQGWKSVYCNPSREGFIGIAATTLDQILVQQKRWSEGDFQIFLSKYSPAWYGLGKISPPLSMAYCIYCLWSPNCLATLYYSIIPSLYLLKGIPLFPQSTNPWFIPFCYLILAVNSYSLGEFLWSGGTIEGWWNEQRMWLYKRTSSYLFAFLDTVLKLMGFSESKFVISNKLLDENVSRRYNEEVMEFGNVDSPMITLLSSMAVINLFCFLVGFVIKITRADFMMSLDRMVLQVLCCGILVLINLPLYNAILFRKDEGRMSSSVTGKSVSLAIFVCTFSMFLY